MPFIDQGTNAYSQYATSATALTDATGTDGTLLWGNTLRYETNGDNWVRWNLSDNNLINSLSSKGIEKLDPVIVRKKLVQPRDEILIPKVPQLKLLDIDDADCLQLPIDYDILKPVSKHKNQHVYDVYDVQEKPWNADEEYYNDGIESKGLRKTSMGFYIKDDQVKFNFRRRKIVELRQPPAFISRYRLVDTSYASQEMKARELLKRYVGEKEYKRYRQFGYIIMYAHGFMWRVPGERSSIHRVEQYLKSKLIATYCVHFANNKIPPTDACVMRMALVQGGIDVLKEHSNVNEQAVSLLFANEMLDDVKIETPGHSALSFVDAAKKVKEVYHL